MNEHRIGAYSPDPEQINVGLFLFNAAIVAAPWLVVAVVGGFLAIIGAVMLSA